MKTNKKSLDLPVGTSFMEYRGEMYVTDHEHGARRVVVSKAGEIDLEYMPSFCDHKLITTNQ